MHLHRSCKQEENRKEIQLVHKVVKKSLYPETSAYKIQMFGNHPKETIQHSENGECLKSRCHVCMKDAKSFLRDMAC
jgi:hypothetical protein